MRSKFRRNWDDINLKIESAFRKRKSRKNAKIRLKRTNGGFSCDAEYQRKVVPYWKKYGYKPAKYWYKIFSEREQKVDPRYIPDDLYYGEIIPYFSNQQFRRFAEDKCYHDLWFSNFKRPRTLCKNIASVYYDADMNLITKEQAIEILAAEQEEFLIKPSVDSGEGRLIQFFEKKDINRKRIEKALDALKANFIVQTSVKQHPEISRLNASSLNTIRVISFLFKDEVHVLSSILRVGAPNAKVDNVSAGGYACPISADGSLKKKAVNKRGEWIEATVEGVKFADIKIPNFDVIISTIKKTHPLLAHFKLVGWDIAIDEAADPVFIEYNVCPGSNQITCGPTFGDLTEEVLDEFFVNRTLRNAQN